MVKNCFIQYTFQSRVSSSQNAILIFYNENHSRSDGHLHHTLSPFTYHHRLSFQHTAVLLITVTATASIVRTRV